MKRFILTLLGITTSLLGMQPQANADFSFEPMQPTNADVFGGLRVIQRSQDAPAQNNRHSPEPSSEVQCVSTPQTGGGYCHRRGDTSAAWESIPFYDRIRDVFYTIDVSETVDANVRTRPSDTHPSEKNPSMILELGVDLE